jgi:hypothetical protein
MHLNTAGLIAIGRFPEGLIDRVLRELAKRVDFIHVRTDPEVGPPPERFKARFKVRRSWVGQQRWDHWTWREELIRSIDDIKPQIVMMPDQDEAFRGDVDSELQRFWASKASMFFCAYTDPMPTCDGRVVPVYPKTPHCLAFKWAPGLTYKNYQGWCQPSNYAGGERFMSTVTVDHYCMWTKEMELQKRQFMKEQGFQ